MVQTRFKEALKEGQVGESLIAGWFKSKGYSVLPVYDLEVETGKGPRVFSPHGQIIATDALVFNAEKAFWIEAKHKTAFTWYRIKNVWNTGIDLKHYGDYCRIAEESPWPVWLMFLHKGGQAKDSPPSPSGLFGGDIKKLMEKECHRCEPSNVWPSGGVFWNKDDLVQFANLDEVYFINETNHEP